MCKSESYVIILTTKLNRSSLQWISELRSTFNSQIVKIKKINKNKTLMLPYYPSPHDLLLQQCCTQNGKRSIKGSLLTSRFCKCYGLVNDSWRSSVFNCSCKLYDKPTLFTSYFKKVLSQTFYWFVSVMISEILAK